MWRKEYLLTFKLILDIGVQWYHRGKSLKITQVHLKKSLSDLPKFGLLLLFYQWEKTSLRFTADHFKVPQVCPSADNTLVFQAFHPSVLRQHSFCPDSAWWFPEAGSAGSLPAGGDFRWQQSVSQQHQHAVHHCLHLWCHRKPSLLQSWYIPTAGGQPQHCRHRRRPHLCPHSAR